MLGPVRPVQKSIWCAKWPRAPRRRRSRRGEGRAVLPRSDAVAAIRAVSVPALLVRAKWTEPGTRPDAAGRGHDRGAEFGVVPGSATTVAENPAAFNGFLFAFLDRHFGA